MTALTSIAAGASALIALLALALRYGSTRITGTGTDGCLFPDVALPDTDLTREVAARLYTVHRNCTCGVRAVSLDMLDATGGLIDEDDGYA